MPPADLARRDEVEKQQPAKDKTSQLCVPEQRGSWSTKETEGKTRPSSRKKNIVAVQTNLSGLGKWKRGEMRVLRSRDVRNC